MKIVRQCVHSRHGTFKTNSATIALCSQYFCWGVFAPGADAFQAPMEFFEFKSPFIPVSRKCFLSGRGATGSPPDGSLAARQATAPHNNEITKAFVGEAPCRQIRHGHCRQSADHQHRGPFDLFRVVSIGPNCPKRSGDRETRDRHKMAPSRVQIVLELAARWWPANRTAGRSNGHH